MARTSPATLGLSGGVCVGYAFPHAMGERKRFIEEARSIVRRTKNVLLST
jgi:hypothetical protein